MSLVLNELMVECQRLVEENQRLQQTMDNSHLQTQVDTLQWQLKQAESSRQMYRAVLEQVSRFLERVHKNLDQVNGKPPPSKCKGRTSFSVFCDKQPAGPFHLNSKYLELVIYPFCLSFPLPQSS
ncbi:hypothetical protein J6590_043313 [Homalodisca vitripennis]|nr:hypothetical protein J6590_043313 [Homalodisca vitripennis]